ncbi:mutator type transposase [Tanacetum coccineum]
MLSYVNNAGLGDENIGNVANDLGDENVEEFDPLFSYLRIQTDNNEGSDHIEGTNNNEGSDHNEGSDNNEASDDNDKSDNSDFKCDIEDRIDDVHVDMQMFKDNIDPNVEWVSSIEPEPQAENNENLIYKEVDLEDFDSEINSDDDEAERRKALRKLGKCHKPVDGNTYTENFYVNQTFPNKDMIKDMVTKISVRTRRELYLTRNDNERVRTKCRGIVHVFSNSGPNEDGLGDGPSRSRSKASGEIEETIKPNLKIPLAALNEQLQKKYEIGLRQYVLELKERNPYTTVKINVERDYEPESMIRQFRRIYVCLGALKSGFKAGQRDLLGLDECFMSRPFPMQILIAVGVDPNYGIYPLAYAIVESENKQAWPWFLDCLRDELELVRNLNFTFVTDKQKGLIPALAETFPYVEHRFCLKHIYDNMKLQWRGQQFKDLLWKCATATTVSYLNRNMEELKGANKELYDW